MTARQCRLAHSRQCGREETGRRRQPPHPPPQPDSISEFELGSNRAFTRRDDQRRGARRLKISALIGYAWDGMVGPIQIDGSGGDQAFEAHYDHRWSVRARAMATASRWAHGKC